MANLLKIRLEKEGFAIHQAKDGQEALNFIKESKLKLDLILLDIILPKLSGFEVLEAIRADSQSQDIPVMIISNLGQESDIGRGQSLGAVEYVVKAKVSIEELIERVKKNLKINRITLNYETRVLVK